MQIRKVKEIPASSQQLNVSNVNIINNNNTASKHTTKDDTKSNLLLRRSSRIDCHHGGEKKLSNSTVTTPTSTTASSTITRTRMYLDRTAVKVKSSGIYSPNDSSTVQNHKIKEHLDPDNSDNCIWHSSIPSDGDCCDDSVNLDLDIACNKNRIEKSNCVKRGKRSLSSTRVAKSNEKNIKRKTALDSNQQLTFSGKVEDITKKELKPSVAYDGGKSDHHMSLRLRKR